MNLFKFKKDKKEEVKEVATPAAPAVADAPVVEDGKISIDDVAKVEIKIGEIKSAEKVENADRLLKLEVDFGDHTRQIVSGIATYYENPADLVGVRCPFITNLAPRKIRGLESNGMIMAALDDTNSGFSLLEVNKTVSAGTKVS